MSFSDWFGLVMLALPTLVIIAIFFDGVRLDVIEPRLNQWRERRRLERRFVQR